MSYDILVIKALVSSSDAHCQADMSR